MEKRHPDFHFGSNNEEEKTNNLVDADNDLILIYDFVDGYLAREISVLLSKFLKNKNKPLIIKINSPGGSVYDMASIITELERIKKVRPIHIDITGSAFSAAAVISLLGDRITISPYGQLMYHKPNWGVYYADLHKHKSYLKSMEDIEMRLFKRLLARTNISWEDYQKNIKTDWYLSPKEAKRYKFVDRIG